MKKEELIQAIVDAQHWATGYVQKHFDEVGQQFEAGQDIAPASHDAAVRLYRIRFADALEAAAKELRGNDRGTIEER